RLEQLLRTYFRCISGVSAAFADAALRPRVSARTARGARHPARGGRDFARELAHVARTLRAALSRHGPPAERALWSPPPLHPVPRSGVRSCVHQALRGFGASSCRPSKAQRRTRNEEEVCTDHGLIRRAGGFLRGAACFLSLHAVRTQEPSMSVSQHMKQA